MPTYLDSLNEKFAERTSLIEDTLARALEEDREVTDAERVEIDRADAERETLQRSIEHYAGLEERRVKVADRVGRIPHTPTMSRVRDGAAAAPEDPDTALLREFPTAGDYAATVHAAWTKRDTAAVQTLERAATAHQKLADNPGIVPRPIVAPVVNRLRAMRPLVESLGVKQAPAPVFDRPSVTQHVDVDVQAVEKDATASQKMVIGKVPVTLATYAGHLNISKQDLRWSQPSLLQVVFDDFGKIYARRTDKAACTTFAAAVTQTQEISSAAGTYTAAAIDAALAAAAQTIGGADGDNGELNHAWVSRDVAILLASLRSTVNGSKLYNVPLVNGTTGDIDGIPTTVDPRFAAATFIVGDASLVDFWEDLEGFLTVDQPDVLGQLVGYAGYAALSVVDATGFVKLTNVTELAE